ncbi:hypothetical protein CHS0354_036788 [Potamilus streckersoni]|uniref:TIR domain-containing protein n=1 Tax=Potamilus streckersoni TaxID=2493646 RepID=A0AAE0T507_9BIVA|nr:hypothetical protein CHS0354_036788 [Potamilus streckersoni]
MQDMARRRLLSVLLIVHVIITATEANVTCSADDTSYLCKNIGNKNDFPHSLHANTRKVTLIGTDELNGYFPIARFNNQTWANVSELTMTKFDNVDFIPAGSLDGLEHLEFLSISSCSDLNYIDPDIFRYAPDLQALHLDENPHLKVSHVEAALVGKLSNLKYLSLIAIQAKKEPAVLGSNFIKALQGKKLTYLDISRANVLSLTPDIWHDTMLTVRYLNMSYSSFVVLGFRLNVSRSNYNLELFDISGCRSVTKDVITTRAFTRTPACDLPPNITYILCKNIVEVGTEVSLQFAINLKKCEINKLLLLDLSNNNFRRLNITISVASNFKAVQVLDLNSNNMEYISPSVLSSFPSLKILDLSKNQLHQMQNMDDFVNIFSRNKDLKILFLRSNSLSVLPANMFSSNIKLRVLDLSDNELTDLNSDWHNMRNLKLIDLRKNRLKNLPIPFLEQLENIYRHETMETKQNTTMINSLLSQFLDKYILAERYRYGYNANKEEQLTVKSATVPQHLTIKLSENPLLCDCDALDFVQWIVTTNIIIVNRTTMPCKYGSREILLNYVSFETVRQTCRLPIIMGTGITSSVAIILCAFTVFIIYRRRHRRTRKDDSLTKLKKKLLTKNKQFKFVVFMPYCSKDYDVVEQNIRPSLNAYLKEKLNTDKDLVCTGADSFVPGMRIIDEIHRCIEESLVVVPVITSAFLQSHWSQEECAVAIKKHRRVVILMEQHTDTSMAITTVKHLIAQYSRATWSNNESRFVISPSWNTICQGVFDIAADTLRNYRKQNAYESNDSLPLFEESV